MAELSASARDLNSILLDCMAGTSYSFETMHRTGLTAAHVTVAAHNESYERAIEIIKNYYAALLAHSNILLLIRDAKDIYRAKQEGKVGLILGMQTSTPIGQDLTNLWIFYSLGVRIMQLTYMGHNSAGDGCEEEPDQGLTFFGRRLVMAMNQIGMLVDLSHCGWKTAEGAINVSSDPVICSHTNPYAKRPIRRNFPDELIKAVAGTGGVIGINAHPAICSTRQDGSQPDLSDFLDCMDYAVDLVGIDHVGIGLDLFDGFSRWEEARWHVGGYLLQGQWRTTQGLERESDAPKIAAGMSTRGYSPDDIRKVLGLNFCRVFQQVWNKPIRAV